MKTISKFFSAILVVSTVLLGPVQATQIDGEITFAGAFIPTGGTGLADATGIDFLENLTIAGSSAGTLFVMVGAGDFAGVMGSQGTINDFSFVDPFTPVTPLWQVGGFSFDLMDVDIVDQTDGNLYLTGVGLVHHDNYTSTSGEWSLKISGYGYGATFGFISSAVAPIPETMTLMLLSIGLLGLGMSIRRRTSEL